MKHQPADRTSVTSQITHISRHSWKPRRGKHDNEHSPKFSSFDDESLDSMDTAKQPTDGDDSFDTQSHATQTLDGQANQFIDPFSPSPNSKSYFVDIHAREVSRSSSVNTIRPLDASIRRSQSSIKPSISPVQHRSTSPLSFLPSPDALPSTPFNTPKLQPPEVSFLDIPRSRPEKTRRSPSFPLLVPPPSTSTLPPTPIPNANSRRSSSFRFRLQSFRRVHRRCQTVTWLHALFSLHKSRPPKAEPEEAECDTSNTRNIDIPNLNDVISDVVPPSFANSCIHSINETTEKDKTLRHDQKDDDIRRGGEKNSDDVCEVTAWLESNALPSQPSPSPTTPPPQVMETMRRFETELADDIVSLADWGNFCRELLDGDGSNESQHRA